MKKLIIFSLAGLLFLSSTATFAHAAEGKGLGLGLKERFEEGAEGLRGNVARIINGTVTGINGTVLTVTSNGKTFTVNTDSKTKFNRHFWGKSSLAEISVNDKVNVWGTWTDSSKTAINARLIRDNSIMKRMGNFVGTVSSTNGTTSFVLNANVRGAQTVTVSSNTKVTNKTNQSLAFSSVAVGDKVRVRGMWDSVNKTITEVSLVHDYSR